MFIVPGLRVKWGHKGPKHEHCIEHSSNTCWRALPQHDVTESGRRLGGRGAMSNITLSQKCLLWWIKMFNYWTSICCNFSPSWGKHWFSTAPAVSLKFTLLCICISSIFYCYFTGILLLIYLYLRELVVFENLVVALNLTTDQGQHHFHHSSKLLSQRK